MFFSQQLYSENVQCLTITIRTVIFIYRYFYVMKDGDDLTNEEIEGEEGRMVVAHNGWVMDADPFVNFADPSSLVSELCTVSVGICI